MNNTDKIDPICGMVGHIAAHDHWFCSDHCVALYEKQEGLEPVAKKPSTQNQGKKIYAQILIATILVFGVWSFFGGWMPVYMGIFFVAVAILKLLDLKGFAQAFGMYDIVAKKYKPYATLYPFIELGLGLSFLMFGALPILGGITFIIMSVGTIGVVQNLLSPHRVQCACLGTKLDIPLTHLTLVEDILMAIMGLLIFLGIS